jgi:hypothetical protein
MDLFYFFHFLLDVMRLLEIYASATKLLEFLYQISNEITRFRF